MTYTLFDLTLRVGRELDIVKEGWATGGAAGPPKTVIDTNYRDEADDYWNDGTVWLTYDQGGSSAAPEGEFGTIASFADTGNVITMNAAPEPVFSATIVSGDGYAIGKKKYPLSILIQKVNEALQDLGSVLPRATVALTATSMENEYAVPTTPSGVNLWDLRYVWLQRLQDVETSVDEPWTPLKNWYIQTSEAGAPTTLVIPYNLPKDYKIWAAYCTPHPEIRTATTQLSETVPVEMVVYSATAKCLRWHRQRTRSNSRALLDDIVRYESKVRDKLARLPIMPREAHAIIEQDREPRLDERDAREITRTIPPIPGGG